MTYGLRRTAALQRIFFQYFPCGRGVTFEIHHITFLTSEKNELDPNTLAGTGTLI